MVSHFTTSTVAVRDQAKHWERILGYRPQTVNNAAAKTSPQTDVPLAQNSESSGHASPVLKPDAQQNRDQQEDPRRRDCLCSHSSSSYIINRTVPVGTKSPQIQQATSTSRVEIANLVSSSAGNAKGLNPATNLSIRRNETPTIPPKPFRCKYCSRSYSHVRSLQVSSQIIYYNSGNTLWLDHRKRSTDANIVRRLKLTFQSKTLRLTMLKGIATSKQTSVQLTTANRVSRTNQS